MPAQSFSSNFSLGVMPELDPKKDPALYNELSRLRGAIRSVAATLDNYTGANSSTGTSFATGRIPYGTGAGWTTTPAYTFSEDTFTLSTPVLKTTTLTSDTSNIGFFSKTGAPIPQPTIFTTPATYVSRAGTPITTTDTFGGYTIAQIAAALIALGLLA
jgi:hypothetical protein